MATKRLPGLDVLRSIAILLVMWDHGVRFLPPSFFTNISPHPLVDGVDLFFVLSGWLVTSQLFHLVKDNNLNRKTLTSFFISRWLRTIPSYWIVLLVNILLLYFQCTPGLLNENALFYFVFLQNVHKPLDLFFWESWSLSVEEWFYVLFPSVLLFFSFLKKLSSAFLFTCLLFLIIGLLIRNGYWLFDSSLSADLYFRKLVVSRLDMIAWGGFAYYGYQKKWFVFSPKIGYFLVGIVLLILCECIPGDWYQKVLKFTLTGFAIALLIPYLSVLTISSRFVRTCFEKLSRLSYALYLVHLGIVAGLLHSFYPVQTGIGIWAVYVLSSFTLAYLLYSVVEKPVLRLRKNLLQSIK